MQTYKIRFFLEGEKKPVVTGPIEKYQSNHWTTFLDGWVDQREENWRPFSSAPMIGVYNIVYWHPKSCRLVVENDLLGQRPLYITVVRGSEVLLSNDFWSVFCELHRPVVDFGAVEQLCNFRRLAPSWKTLVQQIYRLPAGGRAEISRKIPEIKIGQVFAMNQNPDMKIDANLAAEQLNDSIRAIFSRVQRSYRGSEIWFGNSGGLDSRVIPAYAQSSGVRLKGFVVCERRPRGLLNQSEKSARAIAKSYKFPHYGIDYKTGSGWERLLRDVAVNPFGPANFHKNAAFENFSGSLVLTGGNSFTVANDTNAWLEFAKEADVTEAYVRHNIARSSFISRDKKSEYIEAVRSQLKGSLNNDSAFCVSRSIHQSILNQTSPAGAFESMNFAGDFQYIYHPYATNAALHWPEELFYNRRVQLALFKNYFPGLLNIPDQNKAVWKPGGGRNKQSLVERLLRRARTNGLAYSRWLNSTWFVRLIDKVEAELSGDESGYAREIFASRASFSDVQDQLDMIKLSLIVHRLLNGSPKNEDDVFGT